MMVFFFTWGTSLSIGKETCDYLECTFNITRAVLRLARVQRTAHVKQEVCYVAHTHVVSYLRKGPVMEHVRIWHACD